MISVLRQGVMNVIIRETMVLWEHLGATKDKGDVLKQDTERGPAHHTLCPWHASFSSMLVLWVPTPHLVFPNLTDIHVLESM